MFAQTGIEAMIREGKCAGNTVEQMLVSNWECPVPHALFRCLNQICALTGVVKKALFLLF